MLTGSIVASEVEEAKFSLLNQAFLVPLLSWLVSPWSSTWGSLRRWWWLVPYPRYLIFCFTINLVTILPSIAGRIKEQTLRSLVQICKTRKKNFRQPCVKWLISLRILTQTHLLACSRKKETRSHLHCSKGTSNFHPLTDRPTFFEACFQSFPPLVILKSISDNPIKSWRSSFCCPFFFFLLCWSGKVVSRIPRLLAEFSWMTVWVISGCSISSSCGAWEMHSVAIKATLYILAFPQKVLLVGLFSQGVFNEHKHISPPKTQSNPPRSPMHSRSYCLSKVNQFWALKEPSKVNVGSKIKENPPQNGLHHSSCMYQMNCNNNNTYLAPPPSLLLGWFWFLVLVLFSPLWHSKTKEIWSLEHVCETESISWRSFPLCNVRWMWVKRSEQVNLFSRLILEEVNFCRLCSLSILRRAPMW